MKCPEKVTVKKEEDNWFIGILKLEFWQKVIFSENTCDPQEYKSEQTEMQRYISYFWGCIIRTPTTCLQKLTITHDVTQTKVCNLHTSPFGMQKQILRLQISMHHLIAVAVLHACYNLQVFQKNIAVMNSSGEYLARLNSCNPARLSSFFSQNWRIRIIVYNLTGLPHRGSHYSFGRPDMTPEGLHPTQSLARHPRFVTRWSSW